MPPTIYVTRNPAVDGGVDYACVQHAYDVYNETMRLANEALNSCMAAAYAALVVCALATLELPLIGQLTIGLACLIAEYYWCKNCMDTYNQSAYGATVTLQGVLQGCGVSIAYQ